MVTPLDMYKDLQYGMVIMEKSNDLEFVTRGNV